MGTDGGGLELLRFLEPGERLKSVLVIESVEYLPALRSKYPDADYVWVEKDNYLLTERQREQLVEKGKISESQTENFDLRSDLEADTEHELFSDSVRERFLDDETDILTGADPDIEMMIEANGRLFYVLNVEK